MATPMNHGWNRNLSWTHVAALVVFVLVNQSVAGWSAQRRATAFAQPVNQPAPAPGSSLRDRLTDQARRAHVPLRWIAQDPLARAPAWSPGRTQTASLAQTMRRTIAEERLSADVQHRPLPEVEACFVDGGVVVRDIDLSQPCDSGI